MIWWYRKYWWNFVFKRVKMRQNFSWCSQNDYVPMTCRSIRRRKISYPKMKNITSKEVLKVLKIKSFPRFYSKVLIVKNIFKNTRTNLTIYSNYLGVKFEQLIYIYLLFVLCKKCAVPLFCECRYAFFLMCV